MTTETSNEPEKVTIREVYALISEMRTEVTTSIMRLETKFDALEAGRLTTLERQFTELATTYKPVQRLVYGLVTLMLTAVVGAILFMVIR